ncbi:MAG: hypothetical protein PVI80_15125, partial [Anaerolineae bacterium]
VYLKRTAPWFIGLVVHGSAVKGGIIPGCSDIDFQLYLEDPAFSWQGQLPLELGFAIRRDLEGIDLAPFRYVQCYPHTRQPPQDWVRPIPGAYHLLAGELPVAEATDDDLRRSARQALAELDPAPDFLMGKLLGPGGVRLERGLRLLCTKVWPVLYQVLTLQARDGSPIDLWHLPKEQAIRRLPRSTAVRNEIEEFYQAVWVYYPAEDSLEAALAVIEHGVAFLQAARSWWDRGQYTEAQSPG